jgi:hypothetical protein
VPADLRTAHTSEVSRTTGRDPCSPACRNDSNTPYEAACKVSDLSRFAACMLAASPVSCQQLQPTES